MIWFKLFLLAVTIAVLRETLDGKDLFKSGPQDEFSYFNGVVDAIRWTNIIAFIVLWIVGALLWSFWWGLFVAVFVSGLTFS